MDARTAIETLDPGAINRSAHVDRFKAVLTLSERQYEIFLLVGDGLSSAEIEKVIGIGPSTVESHQHQAQAKLGIQDRYLFRAYAAKFVERMGKPKIHKYAPEPEFKW